MNYMNYLDDLYEDFTLNCGDMTITSMCSRVSEVSRDKIVLEAHNGVESEIYLIIQDDSIVDVEICGDWGTVRYRKVLSEEEMNILKKQLLVIIDTVERCNTDGEIDTKTPEDF